MNGDFEIRNRFLYGYIGNEAHVIIPDSVMAIEWGAFAFCENLEQIIIEDNPHYYTEGNRIFSIADDNIVISTDILT